MKRVTITRGKTRRTFILECDPFPKVGDLVTIVGDGAEWTVSKVQACEPLLTISFQKEKESSNGCRL